MVGNLIIIVLLIPTLFSVALLAFRQEQKHRKIRERLERMESKLNQ